MNQKRCTDLPCVYLKNHEVLYNCRLPDLYDRNAAAGITDRFIPGDLAIRTLRKAPASQPALKGEIILHSDQGSQYAPKASVEFCESAYRTQSRSKAGYPYDNAPMERCFNALKNGCLYLYEFRKGEDLYRTMEEFACIKYNYVRPHGYNNYRTPMEVRRAG